jgi:hypothetical protein
MNIYPLIQLNKDQEQIMQEILKPLGTNNKLHTRNKKYKPPTNNPHDTQKTKWATFTYCGPDMSFI